MSDYNLNQLNSIGIHGEYTAHYIAVNSSKNISIDALKKEGDSLFENLNYWMSEISPGVKNFAESNIQSNIVYLSYSFQQNKNETKKFKPQNVGFGITFVLPVLTAILKAKKGDLLIIENPESHLHPT